VLLVSSPIPLVTSFLPSHPVPRMTSFFVYIRLTNLSHYERIMTITSDNYKRCLYYKCVLALALALGGVVNCVPR
jgi:hypothetical protein